MVHKLVNIFTANVYKKRLMCIRNEVDNYADSIVSIHSKIRKPYIVID